MDVDGFVVNPLIIPRWAGNPANFFYIAPQVWIKVAKLGKIYKRRTGKRSDKGQHPAQLHERARPLKGVQSPERLDSFCDFAVK